MVLLICSSLCLCHWVRIQLSYLIKLLRLYYLCLGSLVWIISELSETDKDWARDYFHQSYSNLQSSSHWVLTIDIWRWRIVNIFKFYFNEFIINLVEKFFPDLFGRLDIYWNQFILLFYLSPKTELLYPSLSSLSPSSLPYWWPACFSFRCNLSATSDAYFFSQ